MPTVSAFGESELSDLQQSAEQLASGRRERLTSAHLLVAMVEQGGPAADLLHERRLTRDTLLQAARTASDDEVDPVQAAVQRARDVAWRLRASRPTPLHLLAALLMVRGSAAFRALDQCGIDVHRLRAAALGLGQATARVAAPSPLPAAVGKPQRRSASKAVSVPLMTVRPRQVVDGEAPPRAAAPTDAELVVVNDPGAAAQPPAEAGSARPRRSKPPATEAETKPGRPRRRRSAFSLDKRFKLLNAIGQNLCAAAERGELPPVVGRDAEVEALLDVLAKREANNPCVVGVPGVGKTAILHALAQRIVLDSSLGDNDRHILIAVNFGDLLTGTHVRGALSSRIGELKKEIALTNGRVVLVLDDIHQLLGADATEEFIGELRRGLARGELRCIGATTPEEYQRVIEGDPALHRFVSPIEVDEPDLERACEILEALAPAFAAHHDVELRSEALTYAIAWSARYVPGRALPDKAISIIDLAAARAARRGESAVTPEHVATVVSELSKVPVERLLESDGERMLRLEQALAERVVGHGAQLERIASILRRNAAGLGGQRPIGTFLLLGPTGVGKTETAKAIAAVLFGSPHAMTRLDLSEYSEAHAVARLIGAPPGYIGHEAGGQLTEAVRKRPYQVLLLDELEKAHEEVLETFLPLFDEGRLTDGRGRTIDFTNTVIILTSNIGARAATETRSSRRLGFGQPRESVENPADRVVEAARQRLSPEFFNRLDEVLVFEALAEVEVEEISRRLLQRLADDVYEQREIELCIEPSVVALLLERGGFDAGLGARPMRRAIARWVEAPLAEALLSGQLASGQRVRVTNRDGHVAFIPVEQAAAE